MLWKGIYVPLTSLSVIQIPVNVFRLINERT